MDADGLVMYGTMWCGDCRRAKKVLERRGVGYTWVDVEKTKGARDEMLCLSGGDQRVPTLLLPDGSVLVEPTNGELETRLQSLVA